jgi:hypothetical protein
VGDLEGARDFRFENLVDFAPATMPVTYYDAEHPDGIALDRLPSPEVKHDTDCNWWAHTSATGTVLNTLVIPSRWREWGITRGTLLRAGPIRARRHRRTPPATPSTT